MRSADLAISFFTFLTVLANLATIGMVGLAIPFRRRLAGAVPQFVPALRAEVAAGALGLGWLVAAVSMAGSLWFSEVAGFQPCRLCWIQRACMYPLVVILAVAALTRDRRLHITARSRQLALVLAVTGALVATYHVALERFPSLETGACDPDVPCTLVWFQRLGFITLPYMALSGFLLVITLLAAAPTLRTETNP